MATAVLTLLPIVIGLGFLVAGLATPASPPPDGFTDGSPAVTPEGETAKVEIDGGGIDTDGDGLGDARERTLGTDPRERDTDGDGFPDGMEIACTDRLPAADPLRQDVYVEVDSTAEATLGPEVRIRLQYAFAIGQVENPTGEPGIALHLVESDDDLPQAPVVGNREGPGAYDDIADYREEHFDHDGSGYYYLLVVSNASYRGDPSFAGAGYNGTALVEEHDDTGTMATLVMHELGHAFGMEHGWEGVDDDTYSVTEYRSVMNYNGLYEVMAYANGDGELGRDEWAFVGEDRHLPPLACPTGNCAPRCA